MRRLVTNKTVFPLSLVFLGFFGWESKWVQNRHTHQNCSQHFCVCIRAKRFFNIPGNTCSQEQSQSHIPPKIKISRDRKSLRRTTLLSRLRQAPGELIADNPHFKHHHMFLENTATLLITFYFSFIGLCFALKKPRMKTQSYVTRYAAPPWNSSITFLVFYLCKQKCSSNQCRLNCFKSAVNWSFFLTLLRCTYTPKRLVITFFPSCFFNIIYLVSMFFKFIQSWIMKFLKARQWVHKKWGFFSVFHKFTECLPRAIDFVHMHIHFPLFNHAVKYI